MDWEALFDPQIIKRGWDYYQQDVITNFHSRDGKITATVRGSKRYQVELDVQGDQLRAGSCTCPYATGDRYCKHMAAVLFMADDLNTMGDTPQPDESVINQLLGQATEQQVKAFLAQTMRIDPGLISLFARQLVQDKGKGREDLADYKNRLDRIIQTYTGNTHAVDYEQADRFTTVMGQFLSQEVRRLIAESQLEMAFDVINQLVLKTARLHFDDGLDDEVMWLVDECVHAWRRVLKRADLQLKRKAYAWFQTHAEGLNAFAVDALSLVFESFSEPEFLQEKYAWTSKELRAVRKIRYKSERQRHRYRWAKWHLCVMQQLKLAPDKIEQFCLVYLDVKPVRLAYVDLCVERQDYATAIRQLIAGQQNAHPLRETAFSDRLRRLYRQLAKASTPEQKLSLFALSYQLGDTGFYRALKQQYAASEWPIKRTQLLGMLPGNTDLLPLLAIDQLYPELLAGVMDRPGLQAVQTYQRVLLPKYAPQLIQKYVQELQRLAEPAKSRDQYHQLVVLLVNLSKLPGGRLAANRVADDWRQDYHRRSAMMDELNLYFN